MMGLTGGPILLAHPVVSIGLPLLVLTTSAVLIAMYRINIVKSTSPVSARAARVDVAIEIVRGRFARGEIDADEYNRLVTGLTRTD